MIKIFLFILICASSAHARFTNPLFYNPTPTVSATGAITTTSTTYTLMTGMTNTPPIGTYSVICVTTLTHNTNNSDVGLAIHLAGTLIPASIVSATPQIQAGLTPSLNMKVPTTSIAEVTVNGNQAIECRWATSGGGTATSTNRTFIVERIR